MRGKRISGPAGVQRSPALYSQLSDSSKLVRRGRCYMVKVLIFGGLFADHTCIDKSEAVEG